MSASEFRLKAQLLASTTIGASASFAPVSLGLKRLRELVVTLDVTAAERDTGDETYDVYITTGDGVASWDLIHFPQIITTGTKRYTARVLAELTPQTVASNGAVTAEGILDTKTANAVKTLAAGSVRHGKWGNRLGYEVVIAGTIATGITCSIQVEGR
jgi:hypothetical protein